ncbi:MAG: hypothetical protein ACD_75C01523G0006 [uncultured bacterium]|nr:MAG: hypothetical protein ACD_75C01523G0006 [uncultured bacterium]
MSIANGVEFLNDVKFTVMHALYKEGYDIANADSVAETVKQTIFAKFRGSTIYIPNLKNVSGSREKILALFEEGKKAAEIVRLTGVSNCTVYTHIRNRNRPVKCNKNADMAGMKEVLTMKMHTAKTLLQQGVEGKVCKTVSEELETFILKHWGGVCFSMPRPIKIKQGEHGTEKLITLRERSDLLFNDHLKGFTLKELAARYLIDTSTVKSILRRVKGEREQKIQAPSIK